MLCRFVSSLYTQRLSHSFIRFYLSSFRFLQILKSLTERTEGPPLAPCSATGGTHPDPGLGVFSLLHYVVQAVGPLSARANSPARLPVTPDIVAHLRAVCLPLRSLIPIVCSVLHVAWVLLLSCIQLSSHAHLWNVQLVYALLG